MNYSLENAHEESETLDPWILRHDGHQTVVPLPSDARGGMDARRPLARPAAAGLRVPTIHAINNPTTGTLTSEPCSGGVGTGRLPSQLPPLSTPPARSNINPELEHRPIGVTQTTTRGTMDQSMQPAMDTQMNASAPAASIGVGELTMYYCMFCGCGISRKDNLPRHYVTRRCLDARRTQR